MKSVWKGLVLWLALALAAAPAVTDAQEAPVFKKEEIEQLVAPIALYPDSLVAQILMATTYPLEVVEAARWVKANPDVKDKALEDAMAQQRWDPSVKSLTAFPQVLAMMSDKLDLTQRLGDAFLAQQKDVLDAIQRLRARAQAAGNLNSGKEQTVSTVQESGTTVIKIEPTEPQTVYVPTYNPTVVYGAWPYPSYPPYAYYPPGYVAGTALFSFAAGAIVGSALWGNCNWGRGDVNVNVNRYNNFNRTNIQNSNWSHNADHRRGVQYRDAGSQQRYGRGQERAGAQNREAYRGRAEQGRRDIARGGADQFKGTAAGGRDPARAEGRAGASGGAAGSSGRSAERGGGGLERSSAGAGAFQGVGSGSQTRDFSQRGATSRASTSATGRAGGGGFGGGMGAGAGGGARGGGGMRGGGGRGR